METKINYLAVGILTIVGMVVSAFWYGLFAEPWMEMNNLTMADAEGGPGWIYGVALVASFALFMTLAWLFQHLKVSSLTQGLAIAALLFVGFLFLNTITKNLFSFRDFGLSLIDSGDSFLNFLIGGAVLGSWRKKA